MVVRTVGDGARGVEIEKQEGNIISIELLEGDTEITDPEVIQYVNIQQNKERHVDGTIVTHADRLGQQLRLKVKFDRADYFRYKVELKPCGDNQNYTSTEITKNSNFEYSKGKLNFITDENGEEIIKLNRVRVSPAGGDVFEITATDDNGKTVTAKSKIVTKRLLYYVELMMRDLKYPPTTVGALIEKEYAKHGIVFKKLSTEVIDYSKRNIYPRDWNDFTRKAKEAFDRSPGKTKMPYCLGIAYVNHYAERIEAFYKPSVNIDGILQERIIILPEHKPLWYNMDENNWLISCVFEKNGGKKEVIPEGICSPHQLKANLGDDYQDGVYDAVKIDLTKLKSRGIGVINLKVNLIDRNIAGDATSSIPFVATSRLGEKKEEKDIALAMIHEIGHKIGMVPNGKGMLDKTPAHYFLFGDHCEKPYKCVMFTITLGFMEFCEDCATAVKKVDLKSGI